MASSLFIFYHDETQTSHTQRESDNQSLTEDTNTIRTTDEKDYFEFVFDEEKQQSILVMYPCNICEREFKSGRNLAIHIKSEHEGIESSKHAEENEQLPLNEQVEEAPEGLKFPCDKCQYQAKTRSNLKAHIRSVHHEVDLSNRRSRNLKTHIKSVHEKIKYPCNLCEYKATAKGHLKTHIESVHEKVKYPCNQCDKQFTQKGDLKRHIESVHEKVKYPCNQCDKQFTRKRDVKRHIESVHEKVKYSCKQCDKQFTRKQDVKRHIESVHEKEKYPCNQCNKQFTRKRDVKRHIESVH